MNTREQSLALRPYQLLCLICSMGEDRPEATKGKLKSLLKTLRGNPELPVTLTLNAGDVFAY